jgi:hypothetical protein
MGEKKEDHMITANFGHDDGHNGKLLKKKFKLLRKCSM